MTKNIVEMYPEEVLNQDRWEDEDDGTMPENVATLRDAVIGHRIVKAEKDKLPRRWGSGYQTGLVLTLDNGKRVGLADTSDCCAYTELHGFFLDPENVEHMILGVGTTDGYTTWHIYANWGDILKLQVGWSPGNPFYYGYGFDITVFDLDWAPEEGAKEYNW